MALIFWNGKMLASLPDKPMFGLCENDVIEWILHCLRYCWFIIYQWDQGSNFVVCAQCYWMQRKLRTLQCFENRRINCRTHEKCIRCHTFCSYHLERRKLVNHWIFCLHTKLHQKQLVRDFRLSLHMKDTCYMNIHFNYEKIRCTFNALNTVCFQVRQSDAIHCHQIHSIINIVSNNLLPQKGTITTNWTQCRQSQYSVIAHIKGLYSESQHNTILSFTAIYSKLRKRTEGGHKAFSIMAAKCMRSGWRSDEADNRLNVMKTQFSQWNRIISKCSANIDLSQYWYWARSNARLSKNFERFYPFRCFLFWFLLLTTIFSVQCSVFSLSSFLILFVLLFFSSFSQFSGFIFSSFFQFLSHFFQFFLPVRILS